MRIIHLRYLENSHTDNDMKIIDTFTDKNCILCIVYLLFSICAWANQNIFITPEKIRNIYIILMSVSFDYNFISFTWKSFNYYWFYSESILRKLSFSLSLVVTFVTLTLALLKSWISHLYNNYHSQSVTLVQLYS